MERERDAEAFLKREVEKVGCLFLKWVSPGNAGVPDRILITPAGRIIFVEMKTRTGHLDGLQRIWQKRLQEHHCSAVTVYGKEDAKQLAEIIQMEVTGKGGQ